MSPVVFSLLMDLSIDGGKLRETKLTIFTKLQNVNYTVSCKD